MLLVKQMQIAAAPGAFDGDPRQIAASTSLSAAEAAAWIACGDYDKKARRAQISPVVESFVESYAAALPQDERNSLVRLCARDIYGTADDLDMQRISIIWDWLMNHRLKRMLEAIADYLPEEHRTVIKDIVPDRHQPLLSLKRISEHRHLPELRFATTAIEPDSAGDVPGKAGMLAAGAALSQHHDSSVSANLHDAMALLNGLLDVRVGAMQIRQAVDFERLPDAYQLLTALGHRGR